MSTFPLLMSLADELDNLTTRSYLDDFGLGFYPHRHYHRVPSLSLPSEEEWAEQQQYQQRRNSRSRKFSEPIKENKKLQQQYELQSATTLETCSKTFNFNDAMQSDSIDSIKAQNSKKNSGISTLSNIDELNMLKSEQQCKNQDSDVEKEDYDGYISKHASSYAIDSKYEFPKTQSESNRSVKNFKQSSLEQLDNEEENSLNASPEDAPKDPNK
ncbi:uncharacterized protein LOC129613881 [Condylostylus longicornis]|uniref:uncharacterized protein LOC129613881 n=1 Tax=Condylostylus longicornis TaxID=2530218 RepID=UPI00244E3488|nr:uncharacterized protein LOC129613881 [Condylostylus longicornis]